MKKEDFRKIVKQCVKECIHEALFESGVLTNIISEVLVATQRAHLVEARQEKRISQPIQQSDDDVPVIKQLPSQKKQPNQQVNDQLRETKRKLLDHIGKGAFKGLDLFEGTTPAPAGPAPGAISAPGALSTYAPDDEGVDISGIMQFSKNWGAIVKGKVKDE